MHGNSNSHQPKKCVFSVSGVRTCIFLINKQMRYNLREQSLIKGSGVTNMSSGGDVKFYPYKRGRGNRCSHGKVGGGVTQNIFGVLKIF